MGSYDLESTLTIRQTVVVVGDDHSILIFQDIIDSYECLRNFTPRSEDRMQYEGRHSGSAEVVQDSIPRSAVGFHQYVRQIPDLGKLKLIDVRSG